MLCAHLFRANRVHVLVFLLFFTIYVYSAGGHLYTVDEIVNYLVLEGLSERGSFEITEDSAYVSVFDIRIPGEGSQVLATRGIDGRFYAGAWGIFQPSCAIPFYFLAGIFGDRWVFVPLLFNPFITALTCAALYSFGESLGFGKRKSLCIATIFGLSSFAWVYSKTFHDAPLASLTLLLSVLCLSKSDTEKTTFWAFSGGVLAGLSILTRIYHIIVLPLLAFYLLSKTGRKIRQLALFLLPLTALTSVHAWYSFARFGVIHEIQAIVGARSVLGSPVVGIYGLLFSSGVGIVIYFPLFLVCLGAFYTFSKSNRREAILFACLFTEFLVFYSMFNHPHYPLSWSGYTWGPRYLLPSLPYIALPIGSLMCAAHERIFPRLVISILFIFGLVINLLGVLVNFMYGNAYVWAKAVQGYWPDKFVFDPRYSPVGIHLRVLLENYVPLTTDTYRRIALPCFYDLYLHFKFGWTSFFLFLLVIIILTYILLKFVGSE